MVTILTPVKKDSSVTMDSGAKLDAVGAGGTWTQAFNVCSSKPRTAV